MATDVNDVMVTDVDGVKVTDGDDNICKWF